ncbi:hypothetical protein GYMLUDRAFT_45676 [Collybiopsis luxurians FD-317 M1]|uniref:F-box domain-containing protein n=1 Tax=Collybiopsis luxurians FD-317 M1 TaxID=944289 RepID=A0A0D0B4C3_9AGAR|nr:hypothetical protein GYMLUDRAFT_45676 [Collybiopsis luxurians FD-317 M1]
MSDVDLERSSAINRLRSEILLEVFRFSNAFKAVEDRNFDEKSSTQINNNAVVLSHADSHWRSITLSTPSLWCTFDISLPSTSPDEVPNSLTLLIELHLERSKNAALDIRVAFSPDNVDYGTSFPILPQLFRQAHRWRTAVLVLPDSKELENTAFPKTFPLLQELDIRMLDIYEDGHCSAPVFRAPVLRKLAVSMFEYGGDYGSSCLREVILSWMSPDVVAEFLKDVPEQCHVHIFTLFTPDSSPGLCEVTSTLKTLSITATDNILPSDEDALNNLLQSLTLLNVEGLEFADKGRELFSLPAEQLVLMLKRSESSLTKLTHLKLDGYSLLDIDLLDILNHVPALTSFVLKEAYDPDADRPLTKQFFRRLDDFDGCRLVLVPKLTSIELLLRSEPHPWDALYTFLQSRTLPLLQDNLSPDIARLQEAKIGVKRSEWETVANSWEGKLSKFRLDGLDLKVATRC